MLRYCTRYLVFAIWLCATWAQTQAQPLAFPTAEGFGRFARGGRGGQVIPVTNLDASGPGSFRDCLETPGPRTCIFRVAGIIPLPRQLSDYTIPPYLTIAGQTAPGDGVLIRGELRLLYTHDVIIRHLRIRPGPDTLSPADSRSLSVYYSPDVIVDHCSFGWSTDDTTSTTGDTGTTNVTYQWGIFSEGLQYTPSQETKGSIVEGGEGGAVSFLHNLFTHFEDRIPYMQGGRGQLVNNVFYNVFGASNNAALYSPLRVEFVANHYIQGGPNTPYSWNTLIRNISCGWPGYTCTPAYDAASLIYVRDNLHPLLRPTNTYPQDAIVYQGLDLGATGLPTVLTALGGFPPIPSQTDVTRVKTDLFAKAGATRPRRDTIDARAVSDVKNLTGQSPLTDLATVGGYPPYLPGTPYPDTDGDGIADAWELAQGLNPNDPADGAVLAPNTYTYLENFLNELAGDTIPGLTPTTIVSPTGLRILRTQ